MKKSTLIIILLAFFATNSIYGQVPANQTGMKLFDDYAPDNTGNTDVADKLQTAINYCIANSKTLYVSSGTYLLSKGVKGVSYTAADCGSHTATKSFCITGDALNRPIIKLADGTPGFQTGDSAVLSSVHAMGASGESCLYYSIIKNFDFDLGNNPGAVAVHNASAQDSHISNIKVYGSNFFAGFTGLPGRNSPTLNCEVTGGKYGIYLNYNSLGANIFGVKCTGQSIAAIYSTVVRGMSIVGLEVYDCGGNAIITKGTTNFAGNIVLTDARIELNNPGNYAFNISNRALVLKNVYVKGTNNMVTSTVSGLTWNGLSNTNWAKINRAVFTPSTINTNAAYNLIDGVKSNASIKEFDYVLDAPTDLILRNIPDKIYAFNSPGAFNVASLGTVNAANLQKAIDEHDIVFIPAGTYNISAPLNLKNNSVLIGDGSKRSKLTPTYTPTSHSWMVTTPNVNGYVVIQDIAFNTPDRDYFGAIKWQTSSGFILNVRNYLAAGGSDKARHNYVFTGNAGGKFYSITDHAQLYSGKVPSTEFRKVKVDGTTNPLTFYGLNLERGGTSDKTWQNPYFEASNASNIRSYGSKTETDGIVFRFTNCNNISINSVYAHAHLPPNDPVVISLVNTTNVEINHVLCPYTTTPSVIMIADGNNIVKRSDFVGNYTLGNFNSEVFNQITGIKTNLYNEISIYPTATNDLLNINSTKELKSVQIIDCRGVVLKQFVNVRQINIGSFSKGMYFLKVINSDKIETVFKIVKL